MPPPDENADLPEFTPERAHLLFQGVCGDFPHHNNRSHLDRGVTDNAIWQRHWRRLAVQSAIWYATPSGIVGRRFTSILAEEWQGIRGRSWNSKRPLIFAHVVLTKTLGVRREKEIRARITSGYTSGRGVYTRNWWGIPRRKEPPGRAEPQVEERRSTMPL